MVSYGTWVQGGNVTGSTTGHGPADYRMARPAGTGHTSGGDSPGYISGAATEERDRGAVPTSTSTASGQFGSTTLVAIGPTRDAPYPFDTSMDRDDVGMSLNAQAVISSWEQRYASTITLPPDATGLELEASGFTVVAASVTIPMLDYGFSGLTSVPDVSTPLWIDFYARPGSDDISSGGRLLAWYETGAALPTAEITLSLEAVEGDLDPATGSIVIWPIANYGSSPGWSVPDAPVPRFADWNIGRYFVEDTAKSTTTRWTLRPPRHRFIYDTAKQLPPLRQFPRDDQFASARRIWPAPSSEQGGTRRLGYY